MYPRVGSNDIMYRIRKVIDLKTWVHAQGLFWGVWEANQRQDRNKEEIDDDLLCYLEMRFICMRLAYPVRES
jgi:hypothetical protein